MALNMHQSPRRELSYPETGGRQAEKAPFMERQSREGEKEQFTSTTKPNLRKTYTPLCLDVLISLIFIQKVPSEAEPKE